jgi:hypothetical protein
MKNFFHLLVLLAVWKKSDHQFGNISFQLGQGEQMSL